MTPELLTEETFEPGRLGTWSDIKQFVWAGNATFTLVSKQTGKRFTYKINSKPDKRNPEQLVWFVKVLSGPDNTGDFAYMAMGDPVFGGLRWTMASRVSQRAPSAVALQWFMGMMFREHAPALAQLEVWHEGRCGRCGRKLTVPSSIAAGIGPECAGRME